MSLPTTFMSLKKRFPHELSKMNFHSIWC